jgi:glutathione synthase
MKLAFIVDPLDEFKIYKDTSYAMMREAAARGCELYTLQQEDIFWRRQRVAGNAARLHLTGEKVAWYRSDAAQETDLAAFDAVIMRKDPPFDMEYVYSTYLLEAAEAQGAKVFNRPRAIRDHNEKMAIAKYAQYTAPTVVTRLESVLREFLAEHGDVIFKPLDGMGGSSIFRVRQDDPNVSVIIETLTQLGTRTIMAQRYLPQIVDGDKRVLLIGGKPVPYCLARIPKAGETRGNLAAGGTGVDRRGAGARAARAGAAAGGAGCDRHLPHRNQCHQPHLLSGNHPTDRLQCCGVVSGCSDRRIKKLNIIKYLYTFCAIGTAVKFWKTLHFDCFADRMLRRKSVESGRSLFAVTAL